MNSFHRIQGLETPSVLSRRAATESLSSLSPFQSQIDQSVSNFVEYATDWKAIAAMTAGGLAYRWGKGAALAIGKGHVAAMPLQMLSPFFGLTSEITTYELTSRSLISLSLEGEGRGEGGPGRNLWSWSGRGGWKEGLLSSFVTFATLKGFGRLTAGENLIVQHGAQDLAMVLGHQLVHGVGLAEKQEGSWGEQLLRAEEANLQLGLGMRLAHSLAPRLLSLPDSPFAFADQFQARKGFDSVRALLSEKRLRNNPLLSVGPLLGMEKFFHEIEEKVGTAPLILTALSLAGLVTGTIIYSRYRAALKERRRLGIKEDKFLSFEQVQKLMEDEGKNIPGAKKTAFSNSMTPLASSLPPPQVRSFYTRSLADIIVFDRVENLQDRFRKVAEGLSHPDSNVRAYLVETLGKLMPHMEKKERIECILKIEEALEDSDYDVRLRALKALGSSIPFLPDEERGPRFSKIENFFSDGDEPQIRVWAVDLFVENLAYLPPEEKDKWVKRMEGHLKSPHLDIRSGSFEILNRLDHLEKFFRTR